MQDTENDLSYDSTKLDYQAMLMTSKIAYSACLREIRKHHRDMTSFKPPFIPYLSARWLADEAKYLVIVAETMYTLEEGLSRSQLEVVNKPDVKSPA